MDDPKDEIEMPEPEIAERRRWREINREINQAVDNWRSAKARLREDFTEEQSRSLERFVESCMRMATLHAVVTARNEGLVK